MGKRMINKWLISSVCTIMLFTLTGFSHPIRHDRQYYEQKGDVIWEVPLEEKYVSITFDDGPNAFITPKILDLLKQYDAKATFFVIGNRIDKHVDIIKREILEGHEIGNHTYNHVFFTTNYSKGRMTKEIDLTRKKIYDITGTACSWFRPPGGYINDRVIDEAKKQGYTVVLWSWHQDTEDWKSPGVRAITNKVLKNVRNGDIILMHDSVRSDHNSSQTVEALKIILPELQKRGYKVVTVSELVRKKYLLD